VAVTAVYLALFALGCALLAWGLDSGAVLGWLRRWRVRLGATLATAGALLALWRLTRGRRAPLPPLPLERERVLQRQAEDARERAAEDAADEARAAAGAAEAEARAETLREQGPTPEGLAEIEARIARARARRLAGGQPGGGG